MNAVEFKAESEKEGRPVFKEIPFVRIIIPGDRNNVLECKATEHYMKQYPRAWAAFQAGQKESVVGTPLENWPQITRSQVKEAKYFEVHTVEQLAELNDVHCQRLGMGWSELRNKAKAYLNLASETAKETAQAAENSRLRDEIAALKDQFAQMASQAEKKPGRPKKETVEA
jgi:hypothetical protein